ncbi:MAG: histidinol-phosphate transaminase [Anaerolineales bacterium]|nr:histidinol-phosphate transaminase [Anaerolineales bacterium]
MTEFKPGKLLRGHIREMDPYQPIHPFDVLSEQLGIPPEGLIKLDANENPYGPLPEVLECLQDLRQLHIYPDPESRYLRRALADYHGISEDRILAGAGADELIDLILRAVLDQGDLILNCPPTFSMYAFDASVQAARTLNVPRRKDFSLNLEDLENAVGEESPKILFLASPNNPDGGLVPRADLVRLLDLPLLFVVDEAYIDFAGPGSSALDLTGDYPNLIVLRTFSKWGGLAGLRLGYGVFPEWIIPALWKIKQPYNVNAAAAAAGRVTLKHAEALKERTAAIVRERERLYEKINRLPWLSPYPSRANFILARVSGRDAGNLKDQLADRGILIRYFDKPGLRDHIRISVGTPDQTDKLISELQNY